MKNLLGYIHDFLVEFCFNVVEEVDQAKLSLLYQLRQRSFYYRVETACKSNKFDLTPFLRDWNKNEKTF